MIKEIGKTILNMFAMGLMSMANQKIREVSKNMYTESNDNIRQVVNKAKNRKLSVDDFDDLLD